MIYYIGIGLIMLGIGLFMGKTMSEKDVFAKLKIKMAEKQKVLHIITELLALPLGIFLIWLGIKLDEKKWIKTALIVAGLGNIIIDGYMLWTWFKK